jgi:hypothetical protein
VPVLDTVYWGVLVAGALSIAGLCTLVLRRLFIVRRPRRR